MQKKSKTQTELLSHHDIYTILFNPPLPCTAKILYFTSITSSACIIIVSSWQNLQPWCMFFLGLLWPHYLTLYELSNPVSNILETSGCIGQRISFSSYYQLVYYFHWVGQLGRFSLKVAMSVIYVCVCVCVCVCYRGWFFFFFGGGRFFIWYWCY